MNRKHLLGIGLLSAAMLLTGCSAEIFDGGSQGLVPIELTASVTEGSAEGGTRAGTALNNSYLPSGSTFTVGFSENTTLGSNTTTYQTTNAAGATTCTGTQPYFTLTGASTTVYAYYPSKPGTTFSVQTAQNTDANYSSSDLMYATKSLTKASPTATAALSFGHKMAKIIVNATMGSGITSITAVKIVGGYRTVNVTDATTCTLGKTLTNANSSTNITVFSGTHSSGTLSCAALIPPQRVPATGSTATNFLQIVTNAGTVTYSLNGKQFDSNNVYTFNVTLTASQVGTTVAITDWADNGNATVTAGLTLQTDASDNNGYVTIAAIPDQIYANGNAITPEPSVSVKINNVSIPLTEGTDFDYSYANNTEAGVATVSVTGKGIFSGTLSTNFNISACQGAELSTATVGSIICSHGKVHAATSGNLTTCDGKKLAIVACTVDGESSTGTDSYSHGLALSMEDLASEDDTQWCTSASGSDTDLAKQYISITSECLADLNGLAYTNVLIGKGANYPAAQKISDYRNSCPVPTSSCSDWFLPTIGQWNLILKGLTNSSTNLSMSSNNTYTGSNINTILEGFGGTSARMSDSGLFLSSTEGDALGAWAVYFGDGFADYFNKDDYYSVRAVLAF